MKLSRISTVTVTVMTLLLCAFVPAANAQYPPPDPGIAPAQKGGGTSFVDRIPWILVGAAVVIAVVAIVTAVVVLWNRRREHFGGMHPA